ncbi:carbon-nitrogen hydrolase family protein [Blastopirellula sp. JC732]|uniref:Carbon-nitrogen hydrolase family protein n=1 Tax=Blastopirellula sediminis TaxID=2894196 RepID=A0A9X1MK18_9BACT|nr:carbon-nitrogen hydrolase family protein [Blastopirellula sediminis]MCC9608630.1 carbon-nitrogen hydrolase family protein [Blastopirellula sediminis]MCC9628593.1 carbon-nitrogen hydrolase family protein [Blastopirellula sediminis]
MGDQFPTVRIAAAQASPVFLDRERSTEKAVSLIAEAARQGAQLVAFSEAWLPGYPWWIYMGSPIYSAPFTQQLYANAVRLPSPTLTKLCDAARDNHIYVVMGLTELAGGSLYLGQITISPAGVMIGHRRKLKPTHAERTIWGEGDGSDLFTMETKIGVLGSLNCWEHLQPLTRYAMNYFNEQIHVSAWPSFCLYTGTLHSFSAEANLAVSRSYALETQTFVIHVGGLCDQATFDLLADDEEKARLLRVGGGASEIIDPMGQTIAGPMGDNEEGILIADCDMAKIAGAKMANDPAGHYARGDVTQLLLNRRPRRPVIYADAATPELLPDEPPHSGAIADVDAVKGYEK